MGWDNICKTNHHRPLGEGPPLEFMETRVFTLTSTDLGQVKMEKEIPNPTVFRDAKIYDQAIKILYKIFASPVPWW